MFFQNLISKLTNEKSDSSIKPIEVQVSSIVPAMNKIEAQLFVYQESSTNVTNNFIKEFETKRPDEEIQPKFEKMKSLSDQLGQSLIPECRKKFTEHQDEIFSRTRESIEKLNQFFKDADARKVSYDKKSKVHDGEIGKKVIEMEEFFEYERARIDQELADKLEEIKNEYYFE